MLEIFQEGTLGLGLGLDPNPIPPAIAGKMRLGYPKQIKTNRIRDYFALFRDRKKPSIAIELRMYQAD
jgi:hypothetical protein